MKRWIVPLLIGFTVAVGGVMYARQRVAAEVEHFRQQAEARVAAEFTAAMETHERLVDTLRSRFVRVDDLKTAQEQALRRTRNADHLAAARRLGVGRSPDLEELNRLVESGDLVRLEDNAFYWIQELDLSVPYVTPSMAEALEEIGRRFHAALEQRALPPFRYNISSILRTTENQRELRRVNPNAAHGASPHEFGTTVDVVYHTYDFGRDTVAVEPLTSAVDSLFARVRHRSVHGLAMVYWQELQGVLGRILIDMQREGILLVTLEREQPVFHMTLARPLADE